MTCLALFRLPHHTRFCTVTQHSGEATELASPSSLGTQAGFVVAPFAPSAAQPVVVIRPDEVTWTDMPHTSCCTPWDINASVVDADKERQCYGIDFRNFHAQLTQHTFAKIVLARCSQMVADTDAEAQARKLFYRACDMYPRMFVALVSAPQCGTWLMATPEILLQGSGNSWHTMALAGTMKLDGRYLDFDTPGGHTSAGDICWSEKNRFEQRYVADYIEECIEQLSPDVTAHGPYTTRAGNLVHLRTDFSFTLPPQCPVGRVVSALHPTPAVCGMPKDSTMQFIMSNEQTPRGYYSGFAGPVGIDGQTSLFVSLRCMRMEGRRMFLYAGGGLLADSREEDEWNETEAKMETMRALFKARQQDKHTRQHMQKDNT